MWQQGNKQNKKTNPEVWNILTKPEIDYLIFLASISNFYCLPKIHISALISEAIAKQNNECRSFRT